MKQYIKIDKYGMAPIMFSIIMVIVLSLLAIGFATLVSNDKRQTLDKTLSSQAQYAAESAINIKQREIIEALRNGETVDNNPDNCGDTRTLLDDAAYSGIKITCLTWNMNPGSLSFTSVDSNPVSIPLISSAGAISQITIRWVNAGVNDEDDDDYTDVTNQLTLVNGNLPTLRLAIAPRRSANSVNVVYVNPSSSGTGNANLTNLGSGGIANGICNESSCRITFNTLPGDWSSGGLISISSLNGVSDVTIEAQDGAGNDVSFADAQVIIDATAKSQDVIKRLVVHAPLNITTWKAGFVTSADTLCKNYRVDGNNDSPGPASGTRCPD